MNRLARRLIAVALAVWGLGASGGYAQSGLRSVDAVSTGGGTSALSGGVAGLYANPAYLTAGTADHAFEMQLFRVGAYSGGDLFQFDRYRTLFHRKGKPRLSNDEEKAILDAWFGGTTRSAAAYLEVIPLSITYRSPEGRWGVGGSVRGRVVQRTAVNQGALDLLLRGTTPERTIPIDGRTRLYSTVDVTGAFSYRFADIPLSVGVAPRLILGTAYADGRLDSVVEVGDRSVVHRFDYAARAAGPVSTGLYDTFDAFSPAPVHDVLGTSTGIAGVGGGLDVGLSYALRSGLHVSMSVTDLGMIRWKTEAQTVTPSNNTFRFEGISLNMRRLRNEFGGDMGAYVKHRVDSLARAAYRDVERRRAPFRTGLPTAVHVSSTWDPGAVRLNGGVSMGVNAAAGAVPRSVAAHAGGEVVLGPVPVRAGVRLLGSQALTVSGGVGLHVGGYRLDVGGSVTPRTSVLGAGARYAVSFSLGTVWI